MNTAIRGFFQITVVFLILVQGIQPFSPSQTKSFLPITADQTSASPLLASPPELANLPGQEGLPLDFIPNRGQWDPAVKFVARKDGLSAGIETCVSFLWWWYHHPMTTSIAQASPNIAFIKFTWAKFG